jgi:hypothetical protein
MSYKDSNVVVVVVKKMTQHANLNIRDIQIPFYYQHG